MELIALLFGLWVLHTWWTGNVSWYESHGWPVLLPLNLGIVWFFGFPYYVVQAFDIRPSWMAGGRYLPFWQSALLALTWGGGMLLNQYWFDRAMEAGRRKKGKPEL